MTPVTRTIQTLIASTIAAACAHAAAAQPADGLVVQPPAGALQVTPPLHATNIERVGVDFDLIDGLTRGDVFESTLYGDALLCVVEVSRLQAGGGRLVSGSIESEIPGRFVIARVDDAVSGWFYDPGGLGVVRLRYGGQDGLHYLHQLDHGLMAECAGEPRRAFEPGALRGAGGNDAPQTPADVAGQSQDAGGAGLGGGCGPPDTTFDVMIVYSDDARAAAGGTAAIRAEAIGAVSVMQATYGSCGVLIRTNLVYLAEVAYNESGDYDNHLDRLTDDGDGILDNVHNIRDVVDADFVSLFVADDDSGGLGWCLADEDHAFSVVRWDLAEDNFTLAHEVGHNIGCAHNPEDADCTPTEIGFGHFFWVPSEGMWRHTVMAYSNNNSTRIPYYSHPNCEYEDVPTGTSSRDNLAIIMTRAPVCEEFRLTRMDVWVDFNWRGGQNGSYFQPYTSVALGAIRILDNPPADLPVLHIKAGSTSETLTIDKPMLVEACGGVVTIGQ